MAQRITLNPQQLVTAILKQEGIHQGRWMLQVQFSFSAANAGPTEEEVLPSAIVGVQTVGILEVPDGQDAPSSIVVDASVANPSPSSAKRPARKVAPKA